MSAFSVLFAETYHHGLVLSERRDELDRQTIVATTAEACESLERYAVAYTPVCAVAGTRRLSSEMHRQLVSGCHALCVRLEGSLHAEFGRPVPSGPGVLSSQCYELQYSMVTLLTRFYLMREAIRALRPTHCVFLPDDVHFRFDARSYSENPWRTSLKAALSAQGITFSDWRGSPEGHSSPSPAGEHRQSRRASHALGPRQGPIHAYGDSIPLDRRGGLRLLFVDTAGYDWEPVLRRLREDPTAGAYLAESVDLAAARLPETLHARVTDLMSRESTRYECTSPDDAPNHREVLAFLTSQNLGGLIDQQIPSIGGVDWSSLLPQFAFAASRGYSVLGASDDLACRLLGDVQPDAVCLFFTGTVFAKRLCWQCGIYGVPTVCYQHGGVYGTERAPHHCVSDLQDADYFLTYGEGIRPPKPEHHRIKARFVSVGSTRNTAAAKAHRPSDHWPLRILWVGGSSEQNTIGGFVELEDTRRYRLVSECLEVLSSSPEHIVLYRPSPTVFGRHSDGVHSRLERIPHHRVIVDCATPLPRLLSQSDVVFSASYSSTIWDEAAVLSRPFVVFCDPQQDVLREHFAADVEEAFLWCKSEAEMLAACHRLVLQPTAFMRRLRRKDATAYVRRYVLGEDGDPIDRVLTFLRSLDKSQRDLERPQRDRRSTCQNQH